MDSITKALIETPDKGLNNQVARIRLILNADTSKKKTVILVEGPDDMNFVRAMFGEDAKCVPSAGGKRQLIELINSAEIADKRVIAIRDKDYSDTSKYPVRMFAYDYCSLELMILHHAKIRMQMSKFCVIEDIKKDFPIIVLRHIAPFSYLRKINEHNNLNKTLNKGVLSGSSDNGKELPEMKSLFERLGVKEYLEECTQCVENLEDEDLWNITNGHDICALLGKFSYCGKVRLGEGGYRNLLVNTYRKEDFQDTLLYGSLMDYHEENDVDLYELSGGESNEV